MTKLLLHYAGAEDLAERLDRFETTHQLTSAHMIEALRRGQIDETDDIRSWSILYRTYLAVTRLDR